MNFGKGAQLILAVGIFIVGAIFLNRMHTERQAEGERLTQQVETAQTLGPELAAEIADYEAQLAALELDVNTARTEATEGRDLFLDSVESIEYDEIIFGMAHDRDLEIDQLVASEPSTLNTAGVSFTATTFSIQVVGKPLDTGFASTTAYREFIYATVSDILDFIDGVAINDNFRSATLTSADITVPEPLTEQEIAEMQETEEVDPIEVPSANIQVVVYSYEGV